MKKILSVLLILTMILCVFCSCGEETTLIDSGKVIRIGVVQFENKDEHTQARSAFISKMKESDYADRLEIDFQWAKEDEAVLTTIVDRFVADHVDIIVSVGSVATKAAKISSKGEIPVFFMAVKNPIADQIMTSKTTPVSVTGVTDFVAPDSVIDSMVSELSGELGNLGIIYNTSEVDSIMEINDFKDYMNTSAVSYVEAIISNPFEVNKAVNDLVNYIDPMERPVISPYDGSIVYPNGKDVKIGVDAIYISGDHVSKDSLDTVRDIMENEEVRTIVYVADEDMLVSPKFTTVKPVYRAIGRQTADMVDAYINGTPFDKISCEDPLHYYKVNMETMESPDWIIQTEELFDMIEKGEVIPEEIPKKSDEEKKETEEKNEEPGDNTPGNADQNK